MVVKSIVVALSIMKESIRRRRMVVLVPKSKVLLCVLDKLYKVGLLSGFRVCSGDVYVFFKYVDGVSVIKDLKFYWQKSSRYNVSLKQLLSFKGKYNFSTFILLHSNSGIVFEIDLLMHSQAGGILFLTIEV